MKLNTSVLLPPGSTVQVLHPGDVACGERGTRFQTLLGSCVAIVLTDPRRTIGAVCHIVPSSPASSAAWRDSAFADVALDAMYQLLGARGIDPALCEAYVYGGGNMFPDLVIESNVGDRNARWALQWLACAGIRVLHHDVGGTTYRRLAWTVGPEVPQVTAVPV
mgnify:CR=1 FL=1